MAIDYFYNSVSLLLHGEGANNSTTATDNSPTPQTSTAVGNAKISTAQFKFGSASMLFDGTGDYFTFPDGAANELSAADFTIEAWVRFTGYPANNAGTYLETILSKDTSAGRGFIFRVNGTATSLDALAFQGWADNTLFTDIIANYAFSLNTWYYVAASRVGNLVYLFAALATDTTAVCLNPGGTAFSRTIQNNATTLKVGSQQYDATYKNDFNGYIDDLRLTKSVGRYTADFAVPTEAFPDSVTAGSGVLDLTAPMQTMALYGGATVDLTGPMGTLEVFTGLQAVLAAPMGAIEASFGGGMSLTGPVQALYFVGHDATGENDFSFTAPTQSLAVVFGDHIDLAAPAPQLSVTMTATALLSASLDAPMGTLEAAGTVSAVMQAVLSAPVGAIAATFGGYSWLTAPSPSVSMAATSGAVATISLTCPMFDLVVEGSEQSVMRMDLEAPMGALGGGWAFAMTAPLARLTLIGTATVAITYEAYALNLKRADPDGPFALTRYTNFPFLRIVRYLDAYYGVAADGVYKLTGETDYDADEPTPVAWAFKTAMSDFGTPNLKTLNAAYFAGRFGFDCLVTLYAGESEDNMSRRDYVTSRKSDAGTYRHKFGAKARKERYFALGAEGSTELDLASIEFDLSVLTRRI